MLFVLKINFHVLEFSPAVDAHIETRAAARAVGVADLNVVDGHYAAVGLVGYLIGDVVVEFEYLTVLQPHLERHSETSVAAPVDRVGKIRYAERAHLGHHAPILESAVVEHGHGIVSCASVVEIDRRGHARECAARKRDIVVAVQETETDQIGEHQRAHRYVELLSLGDALLDVGVDIFAKQHVGCRHGRLVSSGYAARTVERIARIGRPAAAARRCRCGLI